MAQYREHLSLTGDTERAKTLLPYSRQVIQALRERLSYTGVTSGSDTRYADDYYIFVRCSPSVDTISIHTYYDDKPEPYEGPIEPPFILSGVVANGLIPIPEDMDFDFVPYVREFYPTEVCAEDTSLNRGPIQSTDLTVLPARGSPGWMYSPSQTSQYSQYVKRHAGLYSGPMASVAQAALGLARASGSYFAETNPALANRIKSNGYQVEYDFQWNRSHGIYVGNETLWLVEISAVGVRYQPLPFIPTTDTQEFYDLIVSLNLRDTLYVLDTFGGLPSGFVPNAWRVALSATGMTPFYSGTYGFSDLHGWTFNKAGNEAHNVARGYDDHGYCYSIHGSVRLRELPTADGYMLEAEYEEQSRGSLYTTSRGGELNPNRYLPFKVYDPAAGHLLSLDAAASEGAVDPLPFCDAPVFTAFIDDELHVVRYYYDPDSSTRSDDFDETDGVECFVTGSWVTQRHSTGVMPRTMYSNQTDPRVPEQDSLYRRALRARPLGFDLPAVSDYIPDPQFSFIRRYLRIRLDTTIVTEGSTITQGVLVTPDGARDSYMFAAGRSTPADATTTRTLTYDALQDPHVYMSYRTFGYGPHNPMWEHPPCKDLDKCGKKPQRRTVICETPYEPNDSCAGQYADQGPWLSQCADADIFVGAAQPQFEAPYITTTSTPSTRGSATARVYVDGFGSYGLPVDEHLFFNRWYIPATGQTPQYAIVRCSYLGRPSLAATSTFNLGDDTLRGVSPAPEHRRWSPTIGVNRE